VKAFLPLAVLLGYDWLENITANNKNDNKDNATTPYMSILIGGSPSTGSSLLRRMLNRHSEIFCGPETSIFAKQELYTDWKTQKSKLFRKSLFGLPNAGWHNFIGVELDSEYIWSRAAVKALVKSSETFPEFIEAFYAKILEENCKCLWAEKTPSNAFTMNLFLSTFVNGKVIHITRNPLDSIASLHLRGKTLYDAVSVYLLNTAKALASENSDRYHLIKYEDLVSEPELTLQQLCDFMEVAYEDIMLEPQSGEGGVISMLGWKSEEISKPNTSSIGRFLELEPEKQTRVMAYVDLLMQKASANFACLRTVAEHLDYELTAPVVVSPELRASMQMELDRDKQLRKLSNYHFRAGNYPLYLNS